jgi:hypothetical protein
MGSAAPLLATGATSGCPPSIGPFMFKEYDYLQHMPPSTSPLIDVNFSEPRCIVDAMHSQQPSATSTPETLGFAHHIRLYAHTATSAPSHALDRLAYLSFSRHALATPSSHKTSSAPDGQATSFLETATGFCSSIGLTLLLGLMLDLMLKSRLLIFCAAPCEQSFKAKYHPYHLNLAIAACICTGYVELLTWVDTLVDASCLPACERLGVLHSSTC